MNSKKTNPVKRFTRALRLGLYHMRKGPDFYYHGCRIELPEHVAFTFKRQLMQGVYEEAERVLIEKYLDPRLPVIELGGSLGVVSAYVGSLLGKDIPYRIVEANPAVLAILEKNANSTRSGRPSEIVHRAVAYGQETIAFEVSDNVHVSRLAAAEGQRTITVQTTTLGNEVEALGSGQAYTLIMDIEGAEWDVLEKDAAALSTCALAIIEFHPAMFAQSGRTVDSFMAMVAASGLEVVARTDNTIACLNAGRSAR